MVTSPRGDVEKVLADMRSALDAGKVAIVNRQKTNQTLIDLNLTVKDMIAELKALTYDNYCSGPEIDRDRKEADKLWIFKIQYDSTIIYVKFKIEHMVNGSVKVLSFHIDEFV